MRRLRELRQRLAETRWASRAITLARGKWGRLALRAALLLPAVALPAFLGFVTFSNQPRFCVSCHYMQPFYDAWKKSSHNHVKCVDCHIPPGAESWLKHKLSASVQVVKYVTRQYGMRPWVEVEDASCLRRGCHETRLLQGKVDFGGVTFDHGPHLASFRRVTRLRCTSCHAQIVQGQHMTVTASTCFLCHFKNTQQEPAMSECRRCHTEIKRHRPTDVPSEAWVRQAPRQPALTQPRYDHKLVLDRSVDCRRCHSNVTTGQGEVPKDRCITCHTDPSRLSRYNDIEFMHRNHVTDHKVECGKCHTEITHKLPPKADTPKPSCQACHEDQHDAARQLYRGEGGNGVVSKANPMFDARVPCEGCHLSREPVPSGRTTSRATAAGCMLCHGERYGQALYQWQAEDAAWTGWARDALARTEQAVGTAGRQHDLGQAAEHLARCQQNVRLVLAGHYIHNPAYAASLLRVARTEGETALALAGEPWRWPAEPVAAPVAKTESACTSCHYDVVNKGGVAFGTTFEHAPHLNSAKLPCETCHAAGGTPQTVGHGRLVVGRDDCRACHERNRLNSPHPQGWRLSHPASARQDRAVCSTCHAAAFCDRCHGTPIPHSADWPSNHRSAAGREAVCQQCHRTSFCDACHRAARPSDHTSQWPQTHGRAYQATPQRCGRCHARSFCTSCHGVTLPHTAAFKQQHGTLAAARPEACARCHQAASCGRCHTQERPPSNHRSAAWPTAHGEAGQQQPQKCALCHGRAACTQCHGLTMPHPAGWALGGHGPTAQKNAGLCARCHPQSYCGQCHIPRSGK